MQLAHCSRQWRCPGSGGSPRSRISKIIYSDDYRDFWGDSKFHENDHSILAGSGTWYIRYQLATVGSRVGNWYLRTGQWTDPEKREEHSSRSTFKHIKLSFTACVWVHSSLSDEQYSNRESRIQWFDLESTEKLSEGCHTRKHATDITKFDGERYRKHFDLKSIWNVITVTASTDKFN